jgi:hypothetical protein
MISGVALQSRKNRLKWLAKASLCFLAIGSLLLSMAMAGSPSLHKFVHKDADSPEHSCLATIIAGGQVLSTQAPDVVPILVCAIFVLVVAEFLLPHSERDLRLPVGRAPPQV